MLTPSTITLAQGETGTVAVSTTLLTGFDQLLTFTITGLPPVIPLIPPFNFAQSARFTLNPAPGVKVSFAPNPVAVPYKTCKWHRRAVMRVIVLP